MQSISAVSNNNKGNHAAVNHTGCSEIPSDGKPVSSWMPELLWNPGSGARTEEINQRPIVVLLNHSKPGTRSIAFCLRLALPRAFAIRISFEPRVVTTTESSNDKREQPPEQDLVDITKHRIKRESVSAYLFLVAKRAVAELELKTRLRMGTDLLTLNAYSLIHKKEQSLAHIQLLSVV